MQVIKYTVSINSLKKIKVLLQEMVTLLGGLPSCLQGSQGYLGRQVTLSACSVTLAGELSFFLVNTPGRYVGKRFYLFPDPLGVSPGFQVYPTCEILILILFVNPGYLFPPASRNR